MLSRLATTPLLAVVAGSAIGFLGIAGALERAAGVGDRTVQVAIVAMLAIGLIGLPKVKVPIVVAIAGLGFLVISTMSAVSVLDRPVDFVTRGWISLVSPIFIALAVAFAVCHSTGGAQKSRAFIVALIGLVVVANVAVGLRQALFSLSAAEIASAQQSESTYLVGDEIRLMGMFATNQDFALFGCCIAPALLALGLSRIPSSKWFLLLSALLYLVILLSLTRASLFSSVIAGVLVFLAWGRGSLGRRVTLTVCTGLVVAGAAGLVTNSFSGIPRVQAAIDRASTFLNLGQDESFTTRQFRTLPRALEVFSENPWGLGAGAAGPVSQSFPTEAPLGTLTTDNGYLLVGLQTGMFGLLAFIGLLVAVAVWLGRSGTPFGRAGSAAVVALLVAMSLAGYWSLLAPMGIVAGVVGLGIGSLQRDSLSTEPDEIMSRTSMGQTDSFRGSTTRDLQQPPQRDRHFVRQTRY